MRYQRPLVRIGQGVYRRDYRFKPAKKRGLGTLFFEAFVFGITITAVGWLAHMLSQMSR